MGKVNHINYARDGVVYCRRVNRVVEFTDEHTGYYCETCKMFAGSAQGNGVECVWEDNREGIHPIHTVVLHGLECDQIATYDRERKKRGE